MSKRSANPLQAFLAIKRKELPLALLMFTYFFLVITVFWILKPIKKTMFLAYYDGGKLDIFGWLLRGSQAELLAKVCNMGVAFGAVIAFSMLARQLRRQQLTLAFSAFCIVCFGLFLSLASTGSGVGVWAFYLFGDLFNTLMVATFFAFLNDSFRPESAKRNYGVIVLGGVAGGAFGSLVVKAKIKDLSTNEWLYLCIGATLLIAVVAVLAGREVEKNPPPEKPEDNTDDAPKKGNAALDGARLVAKSRYLMAIVVMVAIYEIVSTILDFQFTAAVEHYTSGAARGEHFSTVFAITNVFALIFQLFFTGFVMQRFGVHVALLIMPVAILGASAGFLIIPILWVGSSLNTVDNGLNYSINQSAREALYTPTTREEKYKAKAFIDMFVQRSAKALAVVVALGITTVFTSYSSMRILSVFVLVLGAVWLYAARYAGEKFKELEQDE